MKRMFLHGLDPEQASESKILSALGVSTPDFWGSFSKRMERLRETLANSNDSWMLVGTDMGGLMAALWTIQNPRQISRLILLGPTLNRPEFVAPAKKVDTPTLLIHGTRDEVIPHAVAKAQAELAFNKLQTHWVDDDHRLSATAASLDWSQMLGLAKGSS